MDEIVKQALAKWPNVPHCYGWLALDARGAWRMRDAAAQARQLPGDKIFHAALVGFINRNYSHDEQGRWYFQNGPQRVYVNLEATPYIARTDPTRGYVLHTDATLDTIDATWLTETGQLILQQAEIVALLDDRDMAHCLGSLRMDGNAIGDDALLAWLAGAANTGELTLCHRQQLLPIQRLASTNLASHFGFIAQPQADV